MPAMNATTALLPNPYDFMTVSAVAQLLNVDRRTVTRMIERGTLTGYQPVSATGEKPPVMIWRDEAMHVMSARAKLSGGAR